MPTSENTVLTELSSCLRLFLTGAGGEILLVVLFVLLCWAPSTQGLLGLIADGCWGYCWALLSHTDCVISLGHVGLLHVAGENAVPSCC